MASNSNIQILITAKDHASGVLRGVGASAQHLGDTLDRRLKQGLAVAAAGTIALGIAGVKAGIDYEQASVSFNTMTGSVEKGGKLLKEVSEFARKTPFELPEVVEGAKKLLAYNIEAERIIPTFRTLGNIAAGVGKDKLPQLVLAFGQVKAAGKLTGMELRQFTEAGVPLLDELAKQSGKTAAEIKESMENGAVISFGEVETALTNMSSEGGRFFNLMDTQSRTLGGIISNLKDNFTRLALEILGISETGQIEENGLFAKLKKSAEEALVWIEANKPQIINAITTIVNAVITASQFIVNAVNWIRDTWQTSFGKVMIMAIGILVLGLLAAAGSISAIIALIIAVVFAVRQAFIQLGDTARYIWYSLVLAGINAGNAIAGAINNIRNWINNLIAAFRNIVGSIRSALSGVGSAIMAPFSGAFDWIMSQANKVKDALSNLNPFQRHSPSLIDNIKAGAKVIKSEYADIFGSVGNMAGGMNIAGATTNNSNMSIQIYGGINNSGGMTVDEIGRTLARQLELSRQGGF